MLATSKDIEKLENLLDKNNLDGSDVEEDNLNRVFDRETLLDFLREGLREIDNENNEDLASDPMFQDMAKIGRCDDDYFWLNGYCRVEYVTKDDVDCEIDDIKDYLNN